MFSRKKRCLYKRFGGLGLLVFFGFERIFEMQIEDVFFSSHQLVKLQVKKPVVNIMVKCTAEPKKWWFRKGKEETKNQLWDGWCIPRIPLTTVFFGGWPSIAWVESSKIWVIWVLGNVPVSWNIYIYAKIYIYICAKIKAFMVSWLVWANMYRNNISFKSLRKW